VVICLVQFANNLHMLQLIPPHYLLLNGLTFLVPAYSGSCGKEYIGPIANLKSPYFQPSLSVGRIANLKGYHF